LEKNLREDDHFLSRMISPEILLLLTRWYELEGEGALAWIRGRKEWRASEVFKAEILTVLDGLERDSERGFELLLGLKERSEDSDADSFSPDYVYIGHHDEMILYQIGRWGENPIVMLERFDPNGELREILARGLLDSGRGELAQQLLPDLEEGARDAFDQVLGEQVVDNIARRRS
jgi:hypothetical protein